MAGNIRMLSSNTMRQSTGTSGTNTCATAPPATTAATGTGTGLKKPRRLWTLHDRSAVSVNLLKANLAQDGCEEAQLNVAKKLLNDTSDESVTVQNENARLAIYWLIKSSEQGNEEATELLKSCIESEKGINCQNIIDVQMCIDTPRNDKLTVKAARLLYEKLNNGEDFITTTQLESRLLQVRESRTVSFTTPQSLSESEQIGSVGHETSSAKPPTSQLDEDFDEANNLLLQPRAFESLDKKQKLQNAKELLVNRVRPTTSGQLLQDSESTFKMDYNSRSQHGIKLTEDDMTKNASMYNVGEIPPIFLRNQKLTFCGQFHYWNFTSYATISFIQLVILILMWCNISMNLHSMLSIGAVMVGTWSSYNLFGWYWSERRFSDWTTLYQNVLREENWSEKLPITRFYQNYRKPYLVSGLLSALTFMFCNVTAQDKISPYPWLQFTIGSLTILVLLLQFDFKHAPSWEFLCLLAFQLVPVITKLVPIPSTNFLQEYLEFVHSTSSEYMAQYFPELTTTLATQLEYFTIENVRRLLQIFLLSKLFLNAIGRTKVNHGKTLSEVLLILWIFQFAQWSQFLAIGSNMLFVGFCYMLLGITLLILATSSNVNIWRFITGICICFVIISTLLISSSIIFRVFPRDITGLLKLPLIDEISFNEELPAPLTWKEYDINCHQTAWKKQNLGYTQLTCPILYKNRKIHFVGKVAIVHVRNQDEIETSKQLIFEVLVTMKDDSASSVYASWENYVPFRIGQATENFQSTVSVLIPVTNTEDFQLKLIQQLVSLRSGDEIEFIGHLSNSVGGVVPEISDLEKFSCIRCQAVEQGAFALVDHGELLTFGHVKEGYYYMEAFFANATEIVVNYTQNLVEQIQMQFSLNETVSAIADE